VAEIAYRPAALDDAAEIHALLLRLAPEISLLIDTLEREDALYALCRNCARSGESWVATDAAGGIIGVALVAPVERGRHYAENEVLELHHAAAAPEFDRNAVLAALVGRVLARRLPVAATINPQNRTGVTALLETLGFRAAGRQRLRREPGAS